MFVFVYGTLKKGFKNNYLLELSPFMGNGTIQAKAMYNMQDLYPFLIEGKGSTIYGEVYKIDKKVLSYLDYLEGYHGYENFDNFTRKKTSVKMDDRTINAFVYYINTIKYPEIPNELIIKSGKWI